MPANPQSPKKVLIVHPDLSALSAMQAEFTNRGYVAILARDLPTTLLAMTQHYFDAALVASQVTEEGDGWAVGGVLRLVFPRAFVAVIAPGNDVLTLKTAINNGIDEIYQREQAPTEIVSALLGNLSSKKRGPQAVQ